MNCLLEGRDVFTEMPTSFGKRFFQLFSTDRNRTAEDLRRRVPGRCDSSYLLVDRSD